jgi:hypothetical protein
MGRGHLGIFEHSYRDDSLGSEQTMHDHLSLITDIANHRSVGMDVVCTLEGDETKRRWLDSDLMCSADEPTR